ncbi:Kinesin-like calmodulin-binding protein-like protein [Diplonema papillatum]|nr:Kinesin-like calmodulin-binding protein-like protein [Diplonema papillatum]
MITSTEAQLKAITSKSEQLEGLMTGKIEEVRTLKRDRDDLERDVATLRARLEEAEGRFAGCQGELEHKTASLKTVADEYNRAQLLKKKYQNTLCELKGCPRVVVKIRDPSHYNGVQSSRPGSRHEWGAVCVADSCTVNVPSKSKSFVFDSVITPDDPQTAHDLFQQTNGPAMIHDVLTGVNVTIFTFGQRGAGKTFSLFGPSQADPNGFRADGLIDVFISSLFAAMEQNDVDCFTVKAQMLELNNDCIYDLFSDPNQVSEHGPRFEILRDDKGRVHVPGLQQVSVSKAQQLSQLFHWGVKTKDKRAHSASRVGRSHILFGCSVENYNKKGDFRRARLTFVDVTGGGTGAENAWINRTHQSLGDVISVLSTAANQQAPTADVTKQHVPYRNSKLTLLLSDALGGNCKTTMLCCLLPSPSLMEELLTALIYAFHLKCIQNQVSAYDIPADLQKLEEQMRSIDFSRR